ncbi:MAG: hypothetical protein Q9P14_04710 [candidate division KSB1 bacterium]|nr:hypothetical protein [candidate division KSB1 bacterium]
MTEFVLCIHNEGHPASLIVGKVYRRLPDPEAESHNMVRIIDEDLVGAGGISLSGIDVCACGAARGSEAGVNGSGKLSDGKLRSSFDPPATRVGVTMILPWQRRCWQTTH